MNRLILCAIFDRVIDAYQAPFSASRPGQAIRDFQDVVNGRMKGADTRYATHADDFELHQIGTVRIS